MSSLRKTASQVTGAVDVEAQMGSEQPHTVVLHPRVHEVTPTTTTFIIGSSVDLSFTDTVEENLKNVSIKVEQAMESITQPLDNKPDQCTPQRCELDLIQDEQTCAGSSRLSVCAMPLSDLGTVNSLLAQQQRIEKKRRQLTPHTVKLGDNSVNLVGVQDVEACIHEIPPLSAGANVWRRQHRAETFRTNEKADMILTSKLAWFNGAGGHNHTAQFSSCIIAGLTNLTTAQQVTLPKVTQGVEFFIKRAAEAALTEYKIGNRINYRLVQSALNRMLHPVNYDLLRHITFKLDGPILFYDNTYLYAKLLHYVLIYDHFKWTGNAATMQPWASNVNFLNLDAPETTWQQLAATIDNGHIVFVDNYDWDNRDVNSRRLLYLLSSSGHRLSCTATDTHGAPARYYQWESIPITVLTHGKAPIDPDVSIIEGSCVFGFAQSIAARRNEYDQLVQGLYAAMELMGTDLYHRGEQITECEMLSVYLGDPNVCLPMPRDYNFLARLLDIHPDQPSREVFEEMEAFRVQNSEERMRTIAVYCGVLRAMATTLWASVNVTTQHIINRAVVPAIHQDPNLLALIEELDCPSDKPAINNPRCDSNFKIKCRRMFSFYTNTVTMEHIWWQGRTLFPDRTRTGTISSLTYSAMLPTNAPRYGTLLALSTFINAYPVEWGVSERGAHFDISKETVLYGPQEERGWRAIMGDKGYNAVVTGNTPYRMKMYGWQVIQCFCNRAMLEANPPIELDMHEWSKWSDPSSVMAWKKDLAPPATLLPVWNKDGKCYEPCTFRSYVWDENLVVAPRLSVNDGWWLRYSHDGARRTAGCICQTRGVSYDEPGEGMMDLRFLFASLLSHGNRS